jgi:hypothetical protein
MTPEVYALLERMHVEHGSWRMVCYLSKTRIKVLRNVRSGKRKAVSMTFLDRLITTTDVGSLDDFTWFTADDLVALGIWKPVQYAVGDLRIKGDVVTQKIPSDQARRLRLERKKKKKAAAKRKAKRGYY